jgi:hypothetical protein
MALLTLRATVVGLRAGGRGLTSLVLTQGVCTALQVEATTMLAHTADARVQQVGAYALAATGVWAARSPQRAFANALAAHVADATTVAVLCSALARFVRSRLSSHPEARRIGEHLAAALALHAHDAAVAPRVVQALLNALAHLSNEERQALVAQTALRGSLALARQAAEARGDLVAVAVAESADTALMLRQHEPAVAAVPGNDQAAAMATPAARTRTRAREDDADADGAARVAGSRTRNGGGTR